MMDRPALKKPVSEVDRISSKQTRQAQQRYVLKVDGQAKNFFCDKDAALTVGRELKKKYPVVRAIVYDSQNGDSETC